MGILGSSVSLGVWWRNAFDLRLGLRLHIWQGVDVEGFDFFAGPRGAAEEDEAGLDAGLPVEAIDRNHAAKHFPAVVFDELRDHHLKGDAMKRIFGACGVHDEFVVEVYSSGTSPDFAALTIFACAFASRVFTLT